MPDLSDTACEVIAILCSDIHLQQNPPIVRSAEPDWYEAMRRPLRELCELKIEHDCPVIIAGDIFDHWKAPPELINFALSELPEAFAVPGQHDLPNHSYADIEKSAYWTLVQAGKITNLKPGKVCHYRGLRMHGFPWNFEVTGPATPSSKCTGDSILNVAVIHSFIWSGKSTAYKGAPQDSRLKVWTEKLEGYNAAVFGDNHKGFIRNEDDLSIMNCGSLMRRTSAEINYEPQVGLLYNNGEIQPYYLESCNLDKFIDVDQALSIVEKSLDMSRFIDELASLGASGLDFLSAVMRFCKDNQVDKGVRKIIREALDKENKA